MPKICNIGYIYYNEEIALCISAISAMWLFFLEVRLPLWGYMVLWFGGYLMVRSAMNIGRSIIDHIWYKCFKIVKIHRKKGRFSLRRRHLKSTKYNTYIDRFMDDIFEVIWYARKKHIGKVSANLNGKLLTAVVYSISDAARDEMLKIRCLEIGKGLKTGIFEVERLENGLDISSRYMYRMIPKRKELLDVISPQERYQITINTDCVEIGEKESGFLKKLITGRGNKNEI